jgi:hypothetical protein
MCKVAAGLQREFSDFSALEGGFQAVEIALSAPVRKALWRVLDFLHHRARMTIQTLTFQKRGRNGFDGGKEA